MWIWRKIPLVALLAMILVLVSCSSGPEPSPEATKDALPDDPTPTPLPEITIVDREELIIGVDSAFPPFADLDENGDLVGVEVDLFISLAESAGIEYQFVSADWDTLFLDLVAGRFDAVFGGITTADAPDQLVELTDPYLEIGQVAVVLAVNEEIMRVSDLEGATVGVEPRSWGEFAVLGDDAFLPLPAKDIRRFGSSSELIAALFDGLVDAIITHHTVIENYVSVNPGFLRILPARAGDEIQDSWLTAHRFHIAVPKGADELLGTLDAAIDEIEAGGQVAAIIQAWGYRPQFAERPHFAQEASAASLVAGIEKMDEYTVRFVLNRPDPNFDYKMTVPAMAIHSPTNLEEHGGGDELAQNPRRPPEGAQNPVGTGPYALEKWEPGRPLTLTANLDYWGDRPLIETVVISSVRAASDRLALLKSGQVAMMENLGAEDLLALEEDGSDDISFYYRSPVNVAYLGMNLDLAPFDDQSVRLALATCIDQAQLVETTYPTGTLIANQFVPPNTFGFTPGLLWYEQDAEGAAALIETAGFAEGLTVTLSLADQASDFLPDPLTIAAEIQNQLSECSITATIESLAPALFEERLLDGQLGLHLSGWSPDLPGPIGFLNMHFTGVGNGRQFGTPFPAIIELLEQAAGTSDRAIRTDLYGQVNQLLKDEVLFVPLAHASSTLAARSDLPGIITHPVRRESLASVGPITDTAPYTTFIYAVSSLPISLDPSDEVDDMTFQVTNQVFETLVDYEPATTVLTAGLAIEWSANETADVWDFSLRPNVRFHDGTELDADAVILNFERIWVAEHPLHIGRTGVFRYFRSLLGAFRPPE